MAEKISQRKRRTNNTPKLGQDPLRKESQSGGRSSVRRQEADGIRLTASLINTYLANLSRRGSTKATMATYKIALDNLLDYLGPERRIRSSTPREWRDYLRQCGYATATINIRISVINSLLDYCGCKGWKLEQEQRLPTPKSEELTRAEYVQLLQAAKRTGQEQGYLLIKLCCVMGLTTVDLQGITVEAVREGQITTRSSPGKKTQKTMRIPESLQNELLAFLQRQKRRKGAVFLGVRGKMLSRTGLLTEIRKICGATQLPDEKCTFRALRNLHQMTQANIQEKYARLMEQEYEDLLSAEQKAAGWDA